MNQSILNFSLYVIHQYHNNNLKELLNITFPLGNYSERIIMSFSLKRTVKFLFREYRPGTGEITCIHGIRSLATMALYVAHKLIPLSRMPYANRVSVTEVRSSSRCATFTLRKRSDV